LTNFSISFIFIVISSLGGCFETAGLGEGKSSR
jgi:hypothetical protein